MICNLETRVRFLHEAQQLTDNQLISTLGRKDSQQTATLRMRFRNSQGAQTDLSYKG